jgi:hypothetical protein
MGYSVDTINTLRLFTAATTTGAKDSLPSWAGTKTYQANGTTTAGAGAATILVQGSNDGTNWDTIGTITLVLATTTSSDGFSSQDRYAFLRGNVSAISGTGASVSLTVGF